VHGDFTRSKPDSLPSLIRTQKKKVVTVTAPYLQRTRWVQPFRSVEYWSRTRRCVRAYLPGKDLGYSHSWSSIFILYISWSLRLSPLYLFLPHSSILYIILYPLWDLLITLSKYIHVRSSFKGFIEIN
jgi:hypothetical protein